MPEYKRQHYLPAAYLRYFSVDQDRCNRDSWIWRIDGNGQRLVPVKSQCVENYMYSREKAEETEKMFQRIEGRYCHCVDKIKSGRALTEKEAGQLLWAMFDFHLRNNVHKNLTGKEGIEAYTVRVNILLNELLLGKKSGQVPHPDMLAHIEQYWNLRVLTLNTGSIFLTSDNPSLWTSIKSNLPTLDLVTVPITPSLLAVAFDNRVVTINGNQLNSEDEKTLNDGQMQNSVQSVYSSCPLTDAQLETISTRLIDDPSPVSEVQLTSWKLNIQGLPPEHFFSFLTRQPPLL